MSSNNEDNAIRAIKSVSALMYERNQAYAFIVKRGLSNEFLKFVQEKQCERMTNEDLSKLLKANSRVKLHDTSGEDAGHPNRVKSHGTK